MPEPTSVIHDIGYQRYDGPRLGARYVFGSLYAHGVRTAFGLGRGFKAKIFPWLTVGIVGIVATVLMAVRAQTGQQVVSYGQFPQVLTLLIILFCAIVGPELVSRDLFTGVLPLYFSRPVPHRDYALAKLAALVTAVTMVLVGGQLIMFVGAAFTLDGFGPIWTEFEDFLLGAAYSAVHALVFAALALLIASLLRRRAVAAGAVVAAFLVTTPVVGVLSVLPSTTANELAGIASPMTMVGGVGDWIFERSSEAGMAIGSFGPLYGFVTVGLFAACVTLLLLRYRKVAAS